MCNIKRLLTFAEQIHKLCAVCLQQLHYLNFVDWNIAQHSNILPWHPRQNCNKYFLRTRVDRLCLSFLRTDVLHLWKCQLPSMPKPKKLCEIGMQCTKCKFQTFGNSPLLWNLHSFHRGYTEWSSNWEKNVFVSNTYLKQIIIVLLGSTYLR